MPPSLRPGRENNRDGGFSLIEIIVALGILSVVMVALLPQLVVGTQATGTARAISQAKGIAQGQLERMRHLPFHIAPAAGDFIDLLDYYYRDSDPTSAAAPTCTASGKYVVLSEASSGYVSPGALRCGYEPTTGAFYRTVEEAEISGYTMVIDTQFLSGETPPVAVSPLANYDTQVTGKDAPASSQIGVSVTVLYNRRGTIRPVTSYTQIAERVPSVNRIRLEADARVMDVGSVTADGVPLSLSAGLLNLTGAVSFASTAGANLAAISAALATGEHLGGAEATISAPPSLNSAATTAGGGALSTGGCAYVCWGSSSVPGVEMSAQDGLPAVGSAANPAQVLVTGLSNGGLSFGNSTTSDYLTELKLAPPLAEDPAQEVPLLRLHPLLPAARSGLRGGLPGPEACAASATSGALSYLSASGYLRTTDEENDSEVESCSVARSNTIELFPTSFAEHGVVRIELVQAKASCLVKGSTHDETATVDYEAVVEYWNGSGYTKVDPITPGPDTGKLEAAPLATSIGNDLTLGDYISSWSSVTDDEITRTEGAGVAQIKVPGIVRIVSQPVRRGSGTTPAPSSASASATETATSTPSSNESPTQTGTAEATETVSPVATASASDTGSAVPTPELADSNSAVSVTVGALSCKAEDAR